MALNHSESSTGQWLTNCIYMHIGLNGNHGRRPGMASKKSAKTGKKNLKKGKKLAATKTLAFDAFIKIDGVDSESA